MSDAKKKRSRPAKSEVKKTRSPSKPRKLKIEEKRQARASHSSNGGGPALMSAREISDWLGVGRSTLRRYVKSGLVPEIRLGGLRRYDVLAVRAALYKNS